MFKKRHPPAGSSPGTLALPADAASPVVTVLHFTPDAVEGTTVADIDELDAWRAREGILWVDVQGLGDASVLQALGRAFEIHPLALEDVANAPQRPKTASYDEHQLFISRMVRLDDESGFQIEQVAILFSRHYVLTFQERHGDVLDPVRERVRHGDSRMRRSGADYLAYRILDTIIDHYYPVIDTLSAALERLESSVMERPTPEILSEINATKRSLIEIRRGIWPQRDAINALVRGDSAFVDEDTRLFLRDSYDHAVQITEVIDTYREITAGLFNTYLSVASNNMNEVMKVLTIMASIFVPLTFMAGVYGMNFDRMPELHLAWGYPLLLVSMAVLAGGMLLFFRRRGWLGRPRVRPDGGAPDSGR